MAAAQNNEELQNPFRYNTIMNKLRDFRCGIEGDQFDEPGWFYFKLFFYFDAGFESSNRMCSGLLGCNFDQIDKYINNKQYEVIHDNNANITPVMNANTAYNFLRLNGEEERAGKLKNFIRMLSDISTNKPWYFQSIEGLNTAMERKIFAEHELKLEDKPKEITIKCLSDAYDTRIGTLLDLYKDIAYSYALKKEILPANLRKFDMGLFIYSKPIRQLISDDFTMGGSEFIKKDATQMGGIKYRNQKALQQYPLYDNETSARMSIKQQDLKSQNAASNFYASCKYIEFQNCEINYNSGSTGYGAITNTEGFPMEYTIKITFDDIYEERYNEFLVKTIGDFVARDFYKDMLPNSSYKNTQESITDKVYDTRYFPEANSDNSLISNAVNQTVNQISDATLTPIENLSGKETVQRPSGPLTNALNQVIGGGVGGLQTQMRHIALGNLGEYGLQNFTSMVNDINSGNIYNVIAGANNFVNRNNNPTLTTISQESLGETEKSNTQIDMQELEVNEINPKTLGNRQKAEIQKSISARAIANNLR